MPTSKQRRSLQAGHFRLIHASISQFPPYLQEYVACFIMLRRKKPERMQNEQQNLSPCPAVKCKYALYHCVSTPPEKE